MSEKLCGIYKITNVITNDIYVGKSLDINNRFKKHISDFKNNKNKNKYIQDDYNKYGLNNFKFEIIELCNSNELLTKERFWIKKIGTYNIYFSNKVRHLTEEHKQNLSKAKKGKPSPRKGVLLSESHKRNLKKPKQNTINMKRTPRSLSKMSDTITIKFSNEELYEMINLKNQGLSYRKIAELFKCSKRTIEVRIKNIDKFLDGGILYESK